MPYVQGTCTLYGVHARRLRYGVCVNTGRCHKPVSGPLWRPPMATCCRPSTLKGRAVLSEAAEARPRVRRPDANTRRVIIVGSGWLVYSHLVRYSLSVGKPKLLASYLPRSPQQCSPAVRGMPGAPFGSTKSASSHTQHPTGHVAIMATGLSSPVNQRFAASSTARQQDRLTQRAHTR